MARVQHRRSGHPRRLAVRGPLSSIKAKLGILTFTPPSVAQGSGAVNPLTINGFGFTPTAVVNFNGSNVATGYSSSTALTIVVLAATTNVPGFYPVYVTDASYPATSTTVVWAVNYPIPTLASVSPTFAYLGTGATTTTATGTGFFTAGTFGNIDGASTGFAFTSFTAGNVTIPAAIVNAAGGHSITITNPAPGGGTSVPRTFNVRYRTPAITAASPSTIPINSGDVQVTLTDAGGGYYNDAFWPNGGSIGYVDGVAVDTMYLSATQIRITVPAAVTSVPGTKALTVVNPTLGGGGGTSTAFNVTVSAPTTTSLSWSTRPRAFSQFTIRINGTSFVATDTGRMRGQNLATTYVSATALDVVIPASILATAGTDPISVRTLAGYETNGQNFTVLPWAVTDIGATLRQYLRPSSAVDDGSGRASSWPDLSGGDRTPSQSDPNKRPLIVPSYAALNGQPALVFDSTRGDYLGGVQWIELSTAGLIQKGAYNIWTGGVAPPGLQTTANAAIIGADAGNYIAAACLQTNALQAIDSSGATVTVNAASTWANSGGLAFIHRTRKAGGNLYSLANNGTEQSAAHGGNLTLFTPGNQLIGRLTLTTGPISAAVGEIVILDADSNFTHRTQLDNHFADLYATGFPALGAVVTINTVTPSTATQFDVPFSIAVACTGADATCTVNCDAEVLATTFSAGTLTAQLTATSLATAGTKGITVSNVGGISAPKALTIAPYVPGTGPNLTGISVTTKQQYKNAFSLVATGSNFTGASVVQVDGVDVPTTPNSATQLTATIPASATYTSGTRNITVRDGANTSAPQALTVTPRSPQDITGLTVRYKASNVSVSGSNITQANDISGNNYHLAQATSTKQPTLTLSDANFNNKPVMVFDGSNDELVGTTAVNGNILTNTVWVVAVVYRFTTITGTGGPSNPYANNTLLGLSASGYFGVPAKNTPELYAYTNDGAYKNATNTALLNATTQQCVASRGTSTLVVSINGVAGTTVTGVGASNFSTQFLSMGSGSGGNFAAVRIAEALASKVAWLPDDFELWNNYCASEYGTPAP